MEQQQKTAGPLRARVFAAAIRDADEVWLIFDIAIGLLDTDPGLLRDVVAFLGPGRLRLAPTSWQRINEMRATQGATGKRGDDLAEALDGVAELDELWPAEKSDQMIRAAVALAADLRTGHAAIDAAAADLLLGARLAQQSRRVLVVVTQASRGIARLEEGSVVGLHHVVACLVRGAAPGEAEQSWRRMEAARRKAALPFFGPLHPDVAKDKFEAFVGGDDTVLL